MRTGHTAPVLVAEGPSRSALGLVHRVQLPAASDASVGAALRPAVVLLHGQGGDEDGMSVFASTIPSSWVVVSPRGPVPEADGGHSWRHVDDNEWPPLAAFSAAAEAVSRLVRALPTTYRVDPAHVYLMGFSQGAAAAYATALAGLGLVAGIAGLVGFLPTPPRETLERRPLAGLPVFMAEGTRDRLVPPEVSAACLAGLRSAGADVEHHAYPTGHKITREGRGDLALWFRNRGGDPLAALDLNQRAIPGEVPAPAS